LIWPPDSMSLHWPDVTSPAQRATTAIAIDPANKKHLTVVLATPFPAEPRRGVPTFPGDGFRDCRFRRAAARFGVRANPIRAR
jgi:hypothetical protein